MGESDVTLYAQWQGKNGILDYSFKSKLNSYGYVRYIVVQPDGKILIAGNFTEYNGTAVNGIARLNPDGSLDTSFNQGGAGTAEGGVGVIVFQPDGKILIAGSFTKYNGYNRRNIARLNPDGTLDTTFSSGTGVSGGGISAIAIQSDGKILIAGSFTEYNGKYKYRIARLNPDGTDAGGNYTGGNYAFIQNNGVSSILIQPDEKILIAGSFTICNNTGKRNIARLNPDGSLDPTLNSSEWFGGTASDHYSHISAIAIHPNGRILVGGDFRISSYSEDRDVITSIHGAFMSAKPGGSVSAIAIQPDGKILIGGTFTKYHLDSSDYSYFVRLWP